MSGWQNVTMSQNDESEGRRLRCQQIRCLMDKIVVELGQSYGQNSCGDGKFCWEKRE